MPVPHGVLGRSGDGERRRVDPPGPVVAERRAGDLARLAGRLGPPQPAEQAEVPGRAVERAVEEVAQPPVRHAGQPVEVVRVRVEVLLIPGGVADPLLDQPAEPVVAEVGELAVGGLLRHKPEPRPPGPVVHADDGAGHVGGPHADQVARWVVLHRGDVAVMVGQQRIEVVRLADLGHVPPRVVAHLAADLGVAAAGPGGYHGTEPVGELRGERRRPGRARRCRDTDGNLQQLRARSRPG